MYRCLCTAAHYDVLQDIHALNVYNREQYNAMGTIMHGVYKLICGMYTPVQCIRILHV